MFADTKRCLEPVHSLDVDGLIRLAFRPKISYVSDRARQEAFRSPMIMVSNHVRGMDGAALCTLFPGKMIHGVSAKEFMDKPAWAGCCVAWGVFRWTGIM